MERNQRRSQSEEQRSFWCKIFQTKHDIVGAICDRDLLGKVLEEGGIKIKVSKNFYGGRLINESAAVRIMGEVSIGNIIGNQITEVAIRGGFITEENTILIDGVRHAQFVKL